MQQKQLTEGSSLLLDVIRAISVQLVVIGHGISFCAIATFLHPPHFPWMQNIAVLIFFILSGYLISNSIFQKLSSHPNYSFTSYFIDRFSRIYSAFIPALIIIFIVDYISISITPSSFNYYNAFDLKTFIGNVFMLQDFPFLKHIHFKITSFGSARPLWTLAIEWWIYMWFGWLTIKIVKGKQRSAYNLLILFLLSIVPLYNLFMGRGNGLTLYWLFGALIGILYDRYKNLTLSNFCKISLLLSLLIIAGIRVGMTMEEYDPIFALLLAVCLLIGMELCADIKINQKAANVIRFIANYSYTLYLIHFTIYDFLISNYGKAMNAHTLFLTGFLVSNSVSLVIGYLTETKLTKYVKGKLRARFA